MWPDVVIIMMNFNEALSQNGMFKGKDIQGDEHMRNLIMQLRRVPMAAMQIGGCSSLWRCDSELFDNMVRKHRIRQISWDPVPRWRRNVQVLYFP